MESTRVNALGIFEENADRVKEAELCYRTSLSLRKDLEEDPALVPTRISASLWEFVQNNLKQLLDKKG